MYCRKEGYFKQFYLENHSRILERQNAYYHSNKEARKRRFELLEFLEPEEFEAKKEAYRAYQAEYRRKNRDTIRAKQKAKREERKGQKEAEKGNS